MRTTSNTSKGLVAVFRVVAGVVLAALLVAACSDGSGERENAAAAAAANEAQADGGGWDVFAMQANEVEGFATLTEMGMMADDVMIAQATGVDGVRHAGAEREEGIDLAQVRFEVIRSISDWDASESVVVEFYVPTPESAKALEERITGFPPTLLALREKRTREGKETGFYRLVNSRSLWAEQPDGGLVAPLAEDVGGEPEFASELAEIKSLEDLGDHLDAARRECDGECGLSQAPWNR